MTRKDYVAIAGALSDERAALFANHPEDTQRMGHILDSTINSLCKVLARDNARFDGAKFRAACGFGTTLA